MRKYTNNPVRQNNGKWIFNDDDMNMIGLWVSYAAQALREYGCPACVDDAEQFQQKVYDMLDQMGYYDAAKKG